MRWLAALACCLISGTVDAAVLEVVEAAPGLLVHRGLHEDFSPGNKGSIANLVAVVGERSVAVIDSGGSMVEGRELLAAIRERTALPVSHVVNTHVHPDHLLGNAAFPEAQVVGHARLPRALAERGPVYLDNMHRLLGGEAAGSALVAPTITVAIGDTIRLDLGGRILEVRAWPTAHTDTDVTVLDGRTGTLIAGDLLFMERLPVVDGSLLGWLKVMGELAGVPAQRVVPGHGPPSAPWPEALEPQRRYLVGLRDAIRKSLADGRSLSQAVDEIAPPGDDWLLADDNHPRNVTAGYAELEWE